MIPFPIPLMVHSLYIYGKVVVDNMACELLSEDSKSEICEKAYVNLPAYSCCGKIIQVFLKFQWSLFGFL